MSFNVETRALFRAYKSLMAEEDRSPPRRVTAIAMESKKRGWIWEFLLKHCSDARILEQLAEAIPIPNDTMLLKRLFLLRSLSFDIINDSISERTLGAILAMMELQKDDHEFHAQDVVSCNSLRVLSTFVTLECTIKYLREEFDDWQRFYDALEKYWGRCVKDTEEGEEEEEHENVSLLRKELWEIKKHPNLRHELLRKYEPSFLKNRLQSFIDDAWKKSSPTFLETLAENFFEERDADKQLKAFKEGNQSSIVGTEKESMENVIDLQEKDDKEVEPDSENGCWQNREERDKRQQIITLDELSPKTAKSVGVGDVRITNDILAEGRKEIEEGGRRVLETEDCNNQKMKEGMDEMLKEKPDTTECKKHVKRRLPNFKKDYSLIQLEKESGFSGERSFRNTSKCHNVEDGACTLLEGMTGEAEARATKVSENEDPGCLENVKGEVKQRKQLKLADLVEDNHRSRNSDDSAFQPEVNDISMDVEYGRRTTETAIDTVGDLLPMLPNLAGDVVGSHRELLGKERSTGINDVGAVEQEVNDEVTGHTDFAKPDQVEEPISVDIPPWTGSPGPGHQEISFGSLTKRRKRRWCSDAERNPLDLKAQAETSPATEVLKARCELQESMIELRRVVTDPLPEALEKANTLASLRENVAKDGANRENDLSHQSRVAVVSKPIANTSEAITGKESAGVGENEKHKRRSLMDRDPLARTYEWEDTDDIMETQHDTSPSASKRVRLPVTSTTQMPTLRTKKILMDHQPNRRMRTKWSQLEEDILKKEVARYGKGRWKFILQKNKDIFENRTEVDLKDKWRNIERRDGIFH